MKTDTYDHSKPEDRAEYYIVNRTGKKHTYVVPFPMTQDAANRISIVLSLYFMKSQTDQENSDWINGEKGEPFKVKWVPPKKKKPIPKSWNTVIQDHFKT